MVFWEVITDFCEKPGYEASEVFWKPETSRGCFIGRVSHSRGDEREATQGGQLVGTHAAFCVVSGKATLEVWTVKLPQESC